MSRQKQKVTKPKFKPDHIENYFPISRSYDYYSSNQEMLPSSYLEFSKHDIDEGNENRNRINAVGNAKRAFHLQTEMLCDAFGWRILYQDKYTGFPKKLEFLSRCGIISPNILKKLNKKRNNIEHSYYIPNIEEVEDYIDIVELFLMATKDLLNSFPEEIEYEIMKDDVFDVSLGLPEELTTTISMSKGEIKIISGSEIIECNINENEYFLWLSAIMKHYVL